MKRLRLVPTTGCFGVVEDEEEEEAAEERKDDKGEEAEMEDREEEEKEEEEEDGGAANLNARFLLCASLTWSQTISPLRCRGFLSCHMESVSSARAFASSLLVPQYPNKLSFSFFAELSRRSSID